MQSRRSIPNVGPRAQGRKALFMLKGSGVSSLGCPSAQDPGDGAQRTRHHPQTQGSLTMEGEGGDGELGEPPVSYDESVLSQPSHPYNRIIQRILHRHQKKELQERSGNHLMPRAERDYGQGTAATSAPPYLRNIQRRSSDVLRESRFLRTDPEDCSLTSSRRLGEMDDDSGLQWADILKADHCITKDDPLDLYSCDLSSPEDQSVSSLDLAKGYLTDRGLISDRSQDNSSLQERGLDTTRSEPSGLSSLPRLARKRDLQPLDDVLEYFWVYQGISRQLLDRHSPSYLWNREWVPKKPTKLPPLYITTGQKSETASSGYTSSVRSSRPCSEDVDTSEGTPKKNVTTEHHCEQKCQHSRTSPAPDLHYQAGEVQTQNHDGMDSVGGHDDDDSTGQSVSPEEMCEKRPARRVTLVVKMPVLTRESSCSDLLENDTLM